MLQRLPFDGSVDADEYLAGVIPLVGEQKFFWASDFPHPDHPPPYVGELAELVAMLPESARYKLRSDNARDLYARPPRNARRG